MRNIPRRNPKKRYTTNFDIRVPQLRVVDEKAQQIGVLGRDEALKLAQEKETDLILIAPKANPPVAKIMDLNKFLYQEEKKLKEAKKGVRKSVVKDIKLSVFIAKGDFERLLEKGREFLNDGNQLRINLTLRGREMAKRDLGIQVVGRYIANLGDVNIAKEPRQEGRVIRAVVVRKK